MGGSKGVQLLWQEILAGVIRRMEQTKRLRPVSQRRVGTGGQYPCQIVERHPRIAQWGQPLFQLIADVCEQV